MKKRWLIFIFWALGCSTDDATSVPENQSDGFVPGGGGFDQSIASRDGGSVPSILDRGFARPVTVDAGLHSPCMAIHAGPMPIVQAIMPVDFVVNSAEMIQIVPTRRSDGLFSCHNFGPTAFGFAHPQRQPCQPCFVMITANGR